MANTARGTACVRSGLGSPFVGLLQIKLGAVVSANLVAVAVEEVICGPEAAAVISAGHSDGIEGVEAAALMLAHVSVPLDRAAKEVGRPEVGVAPVEVGVIDDVAAATRARAGVGRAGGGAGVGSDVLSLRHTVLGDLERSEVLVGLALLRGIGGELGVGSLHGGSDDGGNESAHLVDSKN